MGALELEGEAAELADVGGLQGGQGGRQGRRGRRRPGVAERLEPLDADALATWVAAQDWSALFGARAQAAPDAEALPR